MDEYSVYSGGQWHRYGVQDTRSHGVKVFLLDDGREYFGQARDRIAARELVRGHYCV